MRTSKQLKWVGLLFLFVVSWTLFLSPQWHSSSFSVPDSNGYDDFLHATATTGIMQWEAPDYKKQQALRRVVHQNAEAYAFVRAGLNKECRVPIQISKEFAAMHSKEVARLKRLTHCLLAKAELMETEGRTDDAFSAYLEAYRFGSEVSRGGLAIDFLSGMSFRALVLERFKSIIPSLTAPQCAKALGIIERIENKEENPRGVTRRGWRWQNATYGFSWRLNQWFKTVKEAVNTRSFTPLRSSRHVLVGKQESYQKKRVAPVRDQLRRQLDIQHQQRLTKAKQ